MRRWLKKHQERALSEFFSSIITGQSLLLQQLIDDEDDIARVALLATPFVTHS